MKRIRRPRRALGNVLRIALLVGLASLPAAADWLKTTDGALLETKGPWTVRGNLVVFELPNGTLASLRLRDIDLEGSRAATEEAARAAAPAAPSPPKEPAVLSLTMDDIPSAQPQAGAETGKSAGPSRYEPVQVVAWSPAAESDVDGTEILGTLRNDGPRIVTGIRVAARLLDEDGEVLATVNAFLGEDSLAPTMTTYFRALFPGIYAYAEPGFEVHSAEIQVEPASPPARDTDG